MRAFFISCLILFFGITSSSFQFLFLSQDTYFHPRSLQSFFSIFLFCFLSVLDFRILLVYFVLLVLKFLFVSLIWFLLSIKLNFEIISMVWIIHLQLMPQTCMYCFRFFSFFNVNLYMMLMLLPLWCWLQKSLGILNCHSSCKNQHICCWSSRCVVLYVV